MNGETPKLEAGSLILPKTAPWLDDWLVEYLAFPNAKYDDQMDALSQFLNWRTTAETRTTFSFDFGQEDHAPQSGHGPGFGASSAEEMLWLLRR